jgi:hypothetical protein
MDKVYKQLKIVVGLLAVFFAVLFTYESHNNRGLVFGIAFVTVINQMWLLYIMLSSAWRSIK